MPPVASDNLRAHTHILRVYYEDTDLAGIVYYANYLRFIERARTEWVRDLGIDQTKMRDEAGLVFAVRRVVADYFWPAQFDDLLTIRTRHVSLSGARIILQQGVWRDDIRLFEAEVTLVCLTTTGKAARLPATLRQAILQQD